MEKHKVLDLITEQEAVQLTKDLISFPSGTGKEGAVGRFIVQWFRQNGIEAIAQPVGGERLNSIGIVRGTGRGLSLSFNGHMDTPYSGDEEDLLRMSRELYERPAHQKEAYVQGRTIYGLGVGNMKAGLAAMMLATKAVKHSGISLKGDLIAAAVVGECSKIPIGQYQGIEFEGSGFGTRYLLSHGIHSDYAMCVDNSNLKITWVKGGVVYLRVEVFGLPGGGHATPAAADRRGSQNAILKMMPLIDAIEEWSRDYIQRKTYKSECGTVMPAVHITSIQAGLPYYISQRPGVCSIALGISIPPGEKPVQVQREVEAAIDKLGVDAKVQMLESSPGHEAKGVSGLVKVIGDNFKDLFQSELECAEPPYYLTSRTDSRFYYDMGIPCVDIGLGLPSAERERVGIDAYDSHPIDDIVKGAKLYAMTALDVCTRTALPKAA